MAEYGSMFLVSGLAAILFFGGWNGPIPIFAMMGWTSGAGDVAEWKLFLAHLAGCANFIGKAVVGVTVMMWIRWTLPRLRIDQVMTTCLKYCVPLAAVCFVLVLVWEVLDVPSPNDYGRPHGEVREAWVEESAPPAPEVDSTAATAAAREGGEG